MKDVSLAILSDIHGNRWALEAVLDDLAGTAVDRTINLGDSLWGVLDPAGTADILMSLSMRSVRGNTDRDLLAPPTATPPTIEAHSRLALTPERRAWLETHGPPFVIDGALACHGTPGQRLGDAPRRRLRAWRQAAERRGSWRGARHARTRHLARLVRPQPRSRCRPGSRRAARRQSRQHWPAGVPKRGASSAHHGKRLAARALCGDSAAGPIVAGRAPRRCVRLGVGGGARGRDWPSRLGACDPDGPRAGLTAFAG